MSAIDINSSDLNYMIVACLEGIASAWWQLVSLEHKTVRSFEEKCFKKCCNEI